MSHTLARQGKEKQSYSAGVAGMQSCDLAAVSSMAPGDRDRREQATLWTTEGVATCHGSQLRVEAERASAKRFGAGIGQVAVLRGRRRSARRCSVWELDLAVAEIRIARCWLWDPLCHMRRQTRHRECCCSPLFRARRHQVRRRECCCSRPYQARHRHSHCLEYDQNQGHCHQCLEYDQSRGHCQSQRCSHKGATAPAPPFEKEEAAATSRHSQALSEPAVDSIALRCSLLPRAKPASH